MSTVARGSACENRVANYLEEKGWLIGSRRHRKGGGDLVATKPGYRPRLYECKASPLTKPWEHFRPAERAELLKTAKAFDCDPFLALAPSAKVAPRIIPSKDWPNG